MFRCLFIQKKLYDYLEKDSSEKETRRIKAHLDICPLCQRRLREIEAVLRLARDKKAPELAEGFWHDFKTDLERRLNAQLVPEFKLKPRLSYRLRPILVYASVLIIILGIGIYRLNLSERGLRLAQSEEELIDEASVLDELAPELSFNHNEDAYIDELNLFSQLEEDSA